MSNLISIAGTEGGREREIVVVAECDPTHAASGRQMSPPTCRHTCPSAAVHWQHAGKTSWSADRLWTPWIVVPWPRPVTLPCVIIFPSARRQRLNAGANTVASRGEAIYPDGTQTAANYLRSFLAAARRDVVPLAPVQQSHNAAIFPPHNFVLRTEMLVPSQCTLQCTR